MIELKRHLDIFSGFLVGDTSRYVLADFRIGDMYLIYLVRLACHKLNEALSKLDKITKKNGIPHYHCRISERITVKYIHTFTSVDMCVNILFV